MSIDKEKITEGPVYVKRGDVILPEGTLSRMLEDGDFDHAQLIAEAFNVFTETGMTPRELGEVARKLDETKPRPKN